MNHAARLVALAVATCVVSPTFGGAERSRAARAEFTREHPCPSTGKTAGACPGWQVDHRIALCAGGADRAGNMQWLSVNAHKAKTKQDVRECRTTR